MVKGRVTKRALSAQKVYMPGGRGLNWTRQAGETPLFLWVKKRVKVGNWVGNFILGIKKRFKIIS